MKVRIKELAQEAKFIRLEENRIIKEKTYLWDKLPDASEDIRLHYAYLCGDLGDLKSHRKCEVREAARAAQLAYAFLRGVPYLKVESKRKPEKDYRFNKYIVPEIKRLTKKFGKLFSWKNESYDEEVDRWINSVDIN
jgi:hypothetical protein